MRAPSGKNAALPNAFSCARTSATTNGRKNASSGLHRECEGSGRSRPPSRYITLGIEELFDGGFAAEMLNQWHEGRQVNFNTRLPSFSARSKAPAVIVAPLPAAFAVYAPTL
jgi:hypothetical protein